MPIPKSFSFVCFLFLVLLPAFFVQGNDEEEADASTSLGVGSGRGPAEIAYPNGIYDPSVVHARLDNNYSFNAFNYDAELDSNSVRDNMNLTTDRLWTWNTHLLTVDSGSDKTIQNQLVTTMYYDFTFPPDGPRVPVYNDTNWTMCLNAFFPRLPSSLISRYADDPGDCSAVIGSKCMAAYRRLYDTIPPRSVWEGENACPPPIPLNSISECADLDTSYSSGWVSYELVNRTAFDNGTTIEGGSLKSVQTTFYSASEPFDSGSSRQKAIWDWYSQGVQMIMLVFQPKNEFLANATMFSSREREMQFMCMVPNPAVERATPTSDGTFLSTQNWLYKPTQVALFFLSLALFLG